MPHREAKYFLSIIMTAVKITMHTGLCTSFSLILLQSHAISAFTKYFSQTSETCSLQFFSPSLSLFICWFYIFNPVLPTSYICISLTEHSELFIVPRLPEPIHALVFWLLLLFFCLFYHPMFIALCNMHRNIHVWICNEDWGTFSTIRSLEGAISR